MKRKLNKGLALLLTLAMLVSMIPGMAFAAHYDTTLELKIDDVSVNAGDSTVYVPVRATANPGFGAFNLTFTFNEDVLTFVDAVDELPDETMSRLVGLTVNPAYNIVSWAGTQNMTRTGILFWLVLDVAPDAVTQNCVISAGLTDDEPSNLCNVDVEYITLALTDGTVTVTGEDPEPETYSVSFTDLPENATIVVTDAAASVSYQPVEYGVYLLEPGSYFYLIYPHGPGNNDDAQFSAFEVVDADIIFDLFGTVEPADPTLWDGTIDTTWYNDIDTAFTLTTAAQFAGFAAIVNNKPVNSAAGAVIGTNTSLPADDFLGKTVTLAVDVDLGGIEDVAGSIGAIGSASYTLPVWSGLLWTPIGVTGGASGSDNGTTGRPFKGVFDGGFHRISNMRVNTGTDSAGLFAELGQAGLVKNVVLASGYVQGVRYAAGVVGRCWGKIDSCANYASVNTTGDRSGGGIAGVLYNNGTYPTLKNSFNAGTIFKGDRRWGGGIAGDSEGLIENCFNIGTGISKFIPYDAIGGIDGGGHSSSGTIINSYSITGTGYPTALTAARPANTPTGAMLSAADMQTDAFVLALGSAFNMDTDEINGGFPILAGMGGTPVTAQTDKTALIAALAAIAEPEDGNFPLEEDYTAESWTPFEAAVWAAVAAIENDDATQDEVDTALANLTAAFGALELLPTAYGQPWTGDADTTWYSDDADSFVIYTAEQFAGFSSLVDSGKAFTGKTVTLGANIDLANKPWSAIGLAVPALVTYTSPINGSTQASISGITDASLPFNGTFDGAGFSISNFALTAIGSGQALFAYLGSSGFVGNFTITGAVNTTATGDSDYIAGIVAYNRGIISRVVSNVDVNGGGDNTYNVAGIAGFNDGRAGQVGGAVGLIYGCINNGAITSGRNKCGGIAGQNAGTIESCANTGRISALNSLSKNGVGGIAGRNGNNNTAVEQGIINNCYNTGTVGVAGQSWVGGITGFRNNLSSVTNCYNIGEIISGNSYFNPIVGGQDTVTHPTHVYNNYSLIGLRASGSMPSEVGTVLDSETMKSAEFLAEINAGERAWKFVENANNGYPVLRAHYPDDSTFVGVVKYSDPVKLDYVSGQTFDRTGFAMHINYSDGSYEVVKDVTVSKTTALSVTDTTITITAVYDGQTYTFPYTINVVQNELSTIEITTQPTNRLYAIGESFSSAGMVVRAAYTNGTAGNVTGYTTAPAAFAAGDTEAIVSYTFEGITKTAAVAVKVLSSTAPSLNGGSYELYTANDMLWFANRVNTNTAPTINGKLMSDIDLSGVTWIPIGPSSAVTYRGTFDGNGKTITLALSGANYLGVFGYVGYGSTIKNLTVDGFVSGTSNYVGGIAGYVTSNTTNAATITNCVNNAAITSTGNYVGGITGGFANLVAVTNCVNNGTINGAYSVGGITGSSGTRVTIDGCVNNGEVNGDYSVGGIVGDLGGAGVISGCVNTGSIYGKAGIELNRGIGGLVGIMSSNGTVDSCYNTGDVSGVTLNIGGLVGYITAATGTVKNSYNTGSVTHAFWQYSAVIGGIVGRINNAGGANVQNNFNIGEVIYDSSINTAEYFGGLVGYAAGITNISNNFYLDTVATKAMGYNTTNTDANAAAVTAVEILALSETLGDAFKQGTAHPILVWQADEIIEEPTDYTVSLVTAAAAVNAGETFTADVIVTGANPFGSFGLKAEISDNVECIAASNLMGGVSTLTSNVKNGVLTLVFIGDRAISAEDGVTAVTLTFKAKTDIGETAKAEISLTEANVAPRDGLHGGELQAADVGDAVEVTMYNLTVTFNAGEGVIMDTATAYVKHGESTLYTGNDYTEAFTVPTPEADEGYTLDSPYWDYTVGTTFAESAVYTATAAKNKYTVTFFNLDGTVLEEQTVSHGDNAETPDAGAVAGKRFEGWYAVTSAADEYDDSADLLTADEIDALSVTDDMMYKAYYVTSVFTLTVPEKVSVEGGAVMDDDIWYVENGTDVTFIFDGDTNDGYTYTVSYKVGTEAAVEVMANGEGLYTIPGGEITDDVEIIISRVAAGTVTFLTYDDFRGAPEGFKIMMLSLPSGKVAGATYLFDETAMFWSAKYPPVEDGTAEGAFVFFVDEDMTAAEALALITLTTEGDGNTEVSYDGNVNGGAFNLVDAQIPMTLYMQDSARYLEDGTFEQLTMLMRLEADVNGDGKVNLMDVQLVLSLLMDD